MKDYNFIGHGGYRGYTASVTIRNLNVTVLNNIIARIQAAGGVAGGRIIFPRGQYYFRGTPNVLTGPNNTEYPYGFYVEGDGEGDTGLYIELAADMPANRGWFHFGQFDVGHYPGQVNNCGIQGLSMYSLEATYRKTAIRMEVASHGSYVKNVQVGSADGTGNEQWRGKDAVALHLLGHEQIDIADYYFSASNPIVISQNPILYPGSVGGTTQGWLSADHFNFHNGTLVPGPLASAASANGGSREHCSVLFENGTDLTCVSFTGRQAMVGGKHGLVISWTSADIGAFSNNLIIENLRSENLTSGPDSWSIWINNQTGTPLKKLTLRNCELDNVAPSGQGGLCSGGLKVRGVNDILLDECHLPQSSGTVAMVEETGNNATECYRFELRGAWVSASHLSNALVLPPQLRKVFTSAHAGFGSNRKIPFNAIWRWEQDYTQSYYPQISVGDVREQREVFVLADGATREFGIDSNYMRTRMALVTVTVTGTTLASTLYGKAEFLLSPNAMLGSTFGCKLLSSVGAPAVQTNSPASGEFGFGCQDVHMGPWVQLASNLNEPALFVVKIESVQEQFLIERAVSFNGTNQAIESVGGATITYGGSALSDKDDFTFFCKYRPDNNTTTQRLFAGDDGAGVFTGLRINKFLSTGRIAVEMVPQGGATVSKSMSSGTITADGNTWHTVLVSVSRSKNKCQIAVDDTVVVDTTADLSASIDFSAVARWAVGRTGGSGTVYYAGDMSALVFAPGYFFDLNEERWRRVFHGSAADGLPLADIGFYGAAAVPSPFLVLGGQVEVAAPYRQGWSYNVAGTSGDGYTSPGSGGITYPNNYRCRNRANSTEWAVLNGPLTDAAA